MAGNLSGHYRVFDTGNYLDVATAFIAILVCSKDGYWPTSAPFSAAFHVKRVTAFHHKAELLDSLISVLRMHPNGQKPLLQ